MANKTIEERMATVETEISYIREDIKDIKENHLKSIYDKLECILKKMSKPNLPLWATFLLTGLFSLVTGLIVAFLKK